MLLDWDCLGILCRFDVLCWYRFCWDGFDFLVFWLCSVLLELWLCCVFWWWFVVWGVVYVVLMWRFLDCLLGLWCCWCLGWVLVLCFSGIWCSWGWGVLFYGRCLLWWCGWSCRWVLVFGWRSVVFFWKWLWWGDVGYLDFWWVECVGGCCWWRL